ncbi:MAG: hypothetical protein ACO1TE_22620 [Prosthecobacter sp.]
MSATPQIQSSISSLKEILVIVTGLTITTSLFAVVTGGQLTGVRSLTEIEPMGALSFVVLLLNVIRFYIGNVRTLDDFYGQPELTNERKGSIGLDFSVILLTGVIFGLMSFYLYDWASFYILFCAILAVDIIWLFLIQNDTHDPAIRATRRKWYVNNIFHLVVLLIFLGPSLGRHVGNNEVVTPLWVLLAFSAVALSNTIFDFWLSRAFYFPKLPKYTEPTK